MEAVGFSDLESSEASDDMTTFEKKKTLTFRTVDTNCYEL